MISNKKNINLLSKINYFSKLARIHPADLKEKLESYITDNNNPMVFFTMTKINKIGINPKSQYGTPLGVYCYPLTQEYFDKLLSNTLPFAGDMPFVNLFKISESLQNTSNYNKEDDDLHKLSNIFIEKTEILLNQYGLEYDAAISTKENLFELFHFIMEDANNKSPISKIWYLTKNLSKNIANWNFILQQLGYIGFYDPGSGIIHPNEPVQAVILNPKIIQPIESFYNPNFALEKEFEKFLNKEDLNIIKQKQENKERLLNLEKINKDRLIDAYKYMSIDDKRILASKAMDVSLPKDIIILLSKESDISIKYNLVHIEKLPVEAIINLIKSKDDYINNNISKNIKLRTDLTNDDIIYLINNGNNEIKISLIKRGDLPLEALYLLAKDYSDLVQLNLVLSYKNLPDEIIRLLLEIGDEDLINIVKNKYNISN